MEYRQVTPLQYERYRQVADEVAAKVSKWVQKPLKMLRYSDVIAWFEATHPVKFIFYGAPPLTSAYVGLVTSPVLKETDNVFNYACAGMSLASGGRYVIAVSQASSKARMVFTLLHEIAHVLCHLGSESFVAAFMPTGHYSEEQQPLEDEANIVASLLFVSDAAIADFLCNRIPFCEAQKQAGMSFSAFYNRLRNYLQYSLRANNSFTYSFLQTYKAGNITEDLWDGIQTLEYAARMRERPVKGGSNDGEFTDIN